MSVHTNVSFFMKRQLICFRPALTYRITLPYYFRDVSPISRTTTHSFTSKKNPKEHFPAFINKSNQQYRSDRAKLLHKMVGDNFRSLRERKGLSIQQVADATKISANHLQKIEAGSLRITPSILFAISNYFDVTIEYIVYQDLLIKRK